MTDTMLRAPDACPGCRGGAPFPLAITMAFQPIVDIERRTVFAYEALVRGLEGMSAGEVLAQVDPEMIYKFDQRCRVTAIQLAGALFGADATTKLSINFIMGVPGADDIMLNYQSTSFHDALYLRRVLGLRPAPEFEAWLLQQGIMGTDQKRLASEATQLLYRQFFKP